VELFVEFADPMPDVPADTRGCLFKMLEEVAASLGEIPVLSPLWGSLEIAPLQLDLRGWRFIYTVRRDQRRLLVIEHKELKGETDRPPGAPRNETPPA
jgi:hypothetical protein